MTDDQGYGDLGVTGNPVLDTPHTDRFARESASLRRFYVSPVCTPTRASLMTGRYNYRTRAIDTWVGRAMMEPEEVTLAEILRDAGYRTGIFGKWHLGDCYPMRPNDQGFDEALVHRGGGLAQPSEPIENTRRYTDAILFRNGVSVQTKGYCTDVYFDAAHDFIRETRAAGKPFFVYLPTNAPHDPFHDVPKALYQKYRQRDLTKVIGKQARYGDQVARIFAMVENIDQNMGRLLGTLDELDVARDTIVVYLHDNGPHLARFVGDMRGTKAQVYEGGIRSPLFVRWPGRLPAGTALDEIGAHIDILPTLLDAVGVAAPKGVRLDGRSLLPLLRRGRVDWAQRTIFIQSHRGDAPVRYHHFAACGPRYKLVRSTGFGREQAPAGVPFELYDLTEDPREQHDIAGDHPEIVTRMKAAYDRWFDDVSATRPDNYSRPRIVVGNDRETTTALTHQDWRRLGGRGWGSSGEWLLTFQGDHAYDVRVLTLQEIRDARVELRVGSLRREVDAATPTRSVDIRNVRIPAGDASLRVRVTAREKGGGQRILPPHHVIVTRR